MTSLKFYSKPRRDNPEARLQKAVLQHLKMTGVPGIIYFHPANEGRRSIVTGANLKALGMLPGVADLVIIKDGRAFFLEIKAKGGRLSEAQAQFGALALEAGSQWACVDCIDAAINTLRNWGVIKPMRVAA